MTKYKMFYKYFNRVIVTIQKHPFLLTIHITEFKVNILIKNT